MFYSMFNLLCLQKLSFTGDGFCVLRLLSNVYLLFRSYTGGEFGLLEENWTKSRSICYCRIIILFFLISNTISPNLISSLIFFPETIEVFKVIWYLKNKQILLILGFYMFTSKVHKIFCSKFGKYKRTYIDYFLFWNLKKVQF